MHNKTRKKSGLTFSFFPCDFKLLLTILRYEQDQDEPPFQIRRLKVISWDDSYRANIEIASTRL